MWIDHFRTPDPILVKRLERDELALGSLKNREEFIDLLAQLPQVHEVPTSQVLPLAEEHHWFSREIGWVDAQLLASCLSWPCRLWTHDRKLALLAMELRVGDPK